MKRATRTACGRGGRAHVHLLWMGLAAGACGPIDIGDVASATQPGLAIVDFEDGPPRAPVERRVFTGDRVRVAVRVRNGTAQTVTDLRATLLFRRREDDSALTRPPRVRPISMDVSVAPGATTVLPLDVDIERATPPDVWRVGVRVDAAPDATLTLPAERWHTWTVERPPLPSGFPGRADWPAHP